MTHVMVGRSRERAVVDALLEEARAGLRLLVLEGEAGIGKTTLWRDAVERAPAAGYRVLSCRAAQAESRLSFTGLADLLGPVETDVLAKLPRPQRRALEIALVRAEASGLPPDRRTIGTGVVSLLASLSSAGPVLLAIDDLQWLDESTAHALEFAIRRLDDHPVAVLVTRRLAGGRNRVPLVASVASERCHRVRVGPLGATELYELVRVRLGRSLTRPLLARLERAARGNPFYVLELARALDAQGMGEPGDALPVPPDLRELAGQRLRRLPRDTQDELLKASALAQPSLGVLDSERLEAALEADILRIEDDGRVEFSHPLFAGALYQGASRQRRRRLHRELAEQVRDVEERARHLALAAEAPDEAVAAQISQGAQVAHSRGAPETAAELAEQSLGLTPPGEAAARWERSLRAAYYHSKAGDEARAEARAEEVAGSQAPAEIRARALQLLAEQRGMREGPAAAAPLLAEALECVAGQPALAAQLEAGLGLISLALLDTAAAIGHLDRAVALAERAGQDAVLAEALMLRALAGLSLGDADAAAVERALALEDRDREVTFQMSPSLNAAQFYEFTGSFRRARQLLLDLRERIRTRGEEGALAYVLVHIAATAWLAGDYETAERESTEAARIACLTGQELFYAFALTMRTSVRAVCGDSEGARADAEQALTISERIGWPPGVHQTRWGLALLALSEADTAAAASALEPVVGSAEQLGVYEWHYAMFVPEAIEAFVGGGERERARRLTEAFAAWGRAHRRPWALALSARCEALLAAAAGQLDEAHDHLERALAEHERLPMPLELARTLLLLGQVERRRGERRAAREALERARAVFEEIGAPLWAARAAAEQHRIGVRRSRAELTANEELMARLAAEGLTNKEIATRMFVSHRTVEANLARAYRKLGIRRRAELGAALSAREAAPD